MSFENITKMNYLNGWLVAGMLVLIGACHNKMEDTTASDVTHFDFQGHRGARGLMPENSVPSFLKALEFGVTTLELDVVISKDSQIVLSHEPWMNHSICQTPNGATISEAEEKSYNIFELTYDEIQTFDCGSLGNPRFPKQSKQKVYKPTLRMVTDSVSAYLMAKNLSPVYYNIETKSSPAGDNQFHPTPDVFMRLVYDEIKTLGIENYTTIQSFDPRTLEVLHELDSSITTALLVYHQDIQESTLEEDLDLLSFQPDIFSCNFEYLNKNMVAAAYQKGIKVIPWTVNEVTDMKRLIEMGVDGLITDYPDRLKEVLEAQ